MSDNKLDSIQPRLFPFLGIPISREELFEFSENLSNFCKAFKDFLDKKTDSVPFGHMGGSDSVRIGVSNFDGDLLQIFIGFSADTPRWSRSQLEGMMDKNSGFAKAVEHFKKLVKEDKK